MWPKPPSVLLHNAANAFSASNIHDDDADAVDDDDHDDGDDPTHHRRMKVSINHAKIFR